MRSETANGILARLGSNQRGVPGDLVAFLLPIMDKIDNLEKRVKALEGALLPQNCNNNPSSVVCVDMRGVKNIRPEYEARMENFITQIDNFVAKCEAQEAAIKERKFLPRLWRAIKPWT